MQNAGLDESQASIKITGKDINNLKMYRWYHSNGRKQIATKESLDEGQKVKWKSFSYVQLFVTPRTIQFLEFSRPEYWSR